VSPATETVCLLAGLRLAAVDVGSCFSATWHSSVQDTRHRCEDGKAAVHARAARHPSMIAVFGASVTQQKSGFAARLREQLDETVMVFGHGGMHLSNAAICFLDEVVQHRPSYCLLDWFSTGYNDVNSRTVEFIDTLIVRLLEADSIPVFLFLPYKGYPRKREFHRFCRTVIRKRQAPSIDVRSQTYLHSLDDLLRDEFHTTDFGSEVCATVIRQGIARVRRSGIRPPAPAPTRYVDVRKVVVGRVFYRALEMSGDCEIIGVLLTIGPHAGLVRISDETGTRVQNTWDRWCHFSRRQLDLAMALRGKVTIEVLHSSFDTSASKKDMDFSKVKKALVVHEVYYVGHGLRVDNVSDGQPIEEAKWLR